MRVVEMLTGRRPFDGDHVTDTLAAILRAEPDWTRLSTAAPEPISSLIARCLRKSLRERLQCVGDARIAIDECRAGSTMPVVSRVRAASRMLWVVSGLAVAAGMFFAIVAGQLKAPEAPSQAATRFTIALPPGLHLSALGKPALALSDDGTQLAYVAAAEGAAPQIYLRAMNRADAVPLAGTDGAVIPFFSPDGHWLGFFADGKLKKISTNGGAPQVLVDVASPQGASWTGHMIVFASDLSVLLKVPDSGGTPQAITRFDAGDIAHSFPRFLPDGKSILFSDLPSSTPRVVVIQRLDSGDRVLPVPHHALRSGPRGTPGGNERRFFRRHPW